MVTLDSNIIRVRADTLSFDAPVDDVRRQLIQFWRCNDLCFQVGIFRGSEVVDVSNFTELHLSLRALDDGHPPSGSEPSLMLGETTVIDTTMTVSDWTEGVKQHGEITFSSEENSVEAGEYWLSIWAKTDSEHRVTLTSGPCRILENGGIATTPPEPKSQYYTAEECDGKFALIGSGGADLSDYYTKSEVDTALQDYCTTEACDEKLEAYYTQTEIDLALQDYYTAEELDDNFSNYYSKSESDTALANYYTADQCDSKFAPIDGGGSGSGGGSGGNGGLVPTEKGELVVGDGDGAAPLSGGGARQVLVADPNENVGLKWINYPWQFRQEITIDTPVPEVVFENVFQAEPFRHYKLTFDFVTTSVIGERVLIVLGYSEEGVTLWDANANEYFYNTIDFSGSGAKYGSYQTSCGFFAFGNDVNTYRNNGGWMHGEMDVWNDCNTDHKVQAQSRTSAYRVYENMLVPNGGFCNFIYRNVAQRVIRSMKIYVADGTLTSGRFTFYGIH